MIEFIINLVVFVSVFTFFSLLLVFTFFSLIVCIKEYGFFNSIVLLPLIVLIFIMNFLAWIVLTIFRCFYSVVLGLYGVLLSGSFKAFKPYFIKGWKNFLPPRPTESDD